MSRTTTILPDEIENILKTHGVEYKSTKGGKELGFACPNGCDDDRRPNEEFHCSINSESGLMHCFKCSFKGNIYDFKKIMGEPITSSNASPKQKQGRPATKLSTIIENSQKALDEEHQRYFLDRGITPENIAKYKLGFYVDNGGLEWYSIPVYQNGECVDVKLRATSENQKPKYKHLTVGSKVTVFGKDELVASSSDSVLICGGEFDKIIAEQMGFGMPVITSTGGEPTFRDEWVTDLLSSRRNIYICFDNDDTGIDSMTSLADKIIKLCPHSSVFAILIPDDLGDHADITDANLAGYTAAQLLGLAEFIGGTEPIDVSRFKEMGVDDIAKVLDLTIKEDNEVKAITFLAMLTAYTRDSQLNLSFNAESSTGKTHIPQEVSKLFPECDVYQYGKVTPTAFYYDEKFNASRAGDNDEVMIDLRHKILIFAEQIDTKLQENLRSVLSHDKIKNRFLLTNKNKQGGNATTQGFFYGYPVAIFCSANMRMDDQERTRCILLSPSTSQSKLEASLNLIEEIAADQVAFEKKVEADENRKLLKDRVIYIKNLDVVAIDTPTELHWKDAFLECLGVKRLCTHHQRDLKKFNSLIKAMALLNAPHRTMISNKIVANEVDVEEAKKLWKSISQSQNYGVPPQALEFYKSTILPAFKSYKRPLTIENIHSYYFESIGDILNDDYLRKAYLPVLERARLVAVEQDPNDRRRQIIRPLVLSLDQDTRQSNEEKTADKNNEAKDTEPLTEPDKTLKTNIEVIGEGVEEISDENIPDFENGNDKEDTM